MKTLFFSLFLFLSLGLSQTYAQCPDFEDVFTRKADCEGPDCTNCPWYYTAGTSVAIRINGVFYLLAPYESFYLNAGDVLCVKIVTQPAACCYSHDEWCD